MKQGRADLINAQLLIPKAQGQNKNCEKDNQVIRTCGEKPSFSFEPEAHWDVGETLGILDFERAARRTLGRFINKRTRMRPMVVPVVLGAHEGDQSKDKPKGKSRN